MSHEMRQFLVIFKNQYFDDFDHEHFGLVLPKKDGYELRCFFTRKAHSAFSPSKKPWLQIWLRSISRSFGVWSSIIDTVFQDLEQFYTVLLLKKFNFKMKQQVISIHFDSFFSTFLTECPYKGQKHGEGPYLRFWSNLGGLTNSWGGLTGHIFFGLGPAHMGGAG